jgi:flagellar basal-body rod protein FlgB
MFIESITGDVVTKALDVAAFNHKVIANNIANAGVKGYSTARLNFDAVMRELRSLVDTDADAASYRDALNRINEKEMVSFSSLPDGVSIEAEMMQLTENTLRYQTLLRARGELGEILKSAISGGGRG